MTLGPSPNFYHSSHQNIKKYVYPQSHLPQISFGIETLQVTLKLLPLGTEMTTIDGPMVTGHLPTSSYLHLIVYFIQIDHSPLKILSPLTSQNTI